MEVNGFQIKEAMRKWIVEKDVAAKLFNDVLFAFKGEEKATPGKIAEQFSHADKMVATLEELQQQYNQQVMVNVGEDNISLALAVKLIGGAGRLEKMWRSAATDTGLDRYSSRQTERDKDNEYAKRQVTLQSAMQYAKDSAKRAASIRSAIAQGNMTKIILGEGAFERFSDSIIE